MEKIFLYIFSLVFPYLLHKVRLCGIIFHGDVTMKITKQKGTRDIILDDVKIWQYVEKNIRDICMQYNLNEIRTPVFEATELFARGVGDETDIVNKEMYTFLDKGGRSITLRPELTAGVVRSYIENGMSSQASPLKLWYIGNMYRYEKMQKGRYREFTQFGLEIFGSNSYLADIETICVSYELFKRLGLTDKIELSINSIGCKSCRAKYIEALKEYVKPRLDNMCDNCKIRYEKNPMRIIDCKEEKCKSELENVPMITDYLCDECRDDFEKVCTTLDNIGITYVIDKKIVRGLDYYNKTVYEYTAKDLGLATGGGGRYDKLVETLGGNTTPAVGFGLGIDRIILLLKEYNMCENIDKNVDIYFTIIDERAYPKAINIVNEIRRCGYIVDIDICKRSFKSQLKYADKIKSKYACIIGEDELNREKCIIRNMNDGTQVESNLTSCDIIKCIER